MGHNINIYFLFLSQLKSHMFKHQKVAHFLCTKDGCKWFFKRELDRCAHVKGHTGLLLKCEECNYSTTDKQYLKQHSHVHCSEFVCFCPKCGKGFKFYEQKTRHLAKPCQKVERTSDLF